MRLCYARCSRPSAEAIAHENELIRPVQSSAGDINWGRERADTALNPDIRNTTNKRRMRQLFVEYRVPMPKLLTETEAEDWVSEGLRIVGRPDKHTRGRGFWDISGVNAWTKLHEAYEGTSRKAPATHFMEYIEAPHEYRVHIFKGKSIRISEKLQGEHGETSHGNYTTIKPTGPVGHVRKAGKQAVAALGLDFGAVDILATDTDCWVLEVNAAPGLGGSMPKLYADTFQAWWEGGWDESA